MITLLTGIKINFWNPAVVHTEAEDNSGMSVSYREGWYSRRKGQWSRRVRGLQGNSLVQGDTRSKLLKREFEHSMHLSTSDLTECWSLLGESKF
jgi:hypothetical protein